MTAAEVFTEIKEAERKSILSIVREVSEASGVSVSEILGTDRKRRVSWPRHLAQWEAVETGYSLTQVGEFFDRDHTSILNAHRRVSERVKEINRKEK